MAPHIDRRLTKKIDSASHSGQVEAILVFTEDGLPDLPVDGKFLTHIVEGVIQHTGDLPDAVRYFPRANAVVISANSKLIKELLQDENLAVASAVDFDLLDLF